MTFKSSNTEWIEALSTSKLIEVIRIAMSQDCIRPCHVFDAVDEALDRLAKLTKSEASAVKKDGGQP